MTQLSTRLPPTSPASPATSCRTPPSAASSPPSTTLNGSELPATNDLPGAYRGADDITTGHTDKAGWGIAASATRDGRSLMAVVLGAPTEQARNDAARALLDYGFSVA
jgi:D-alanyl-D-alanine carboxypeptidase